MISSGKQNSGKQSSFFNSSGVHRFSHGGLLRQKKRGRGERALSTKEPLHAVFKIERLRLRQKSLRAPQSFKLVLNIIEKFAKHFAVKIEQLSVQNDHIHLLIRTSRRKHYHHFFRVVAAYSRQIAQSFEKEGLLAAALMTHTPPLHSGQAKADVGGGYAKTSLWKYRPFSRVVRGYKTYKIVRNYIQLNEKEARGEIKYQKKRLKGLSTSEWQILWA